MTADGIQRVETIELVTSRHPDEMVYDLILDGDMTYTANGFIVHTE